VNACGVLFSEYRRNRIEQACLIRYADDANTTDNNNDKRRGAPNDNDIRTIRAEVVGLSRKTHFCVME
jgi:hypothetical protein